MAYRLTVTSQRKTSQSQPEPSAWMFGASGVAVEEAEPHDSRQQVEEVEEVEERAFHSRHSTQANYPQPSK